MYLNIRVLLLGFRIATLYYILIESNWFRAIISMIDVKVCRNDYFFQINLLQMTNVHIRREREGEGRVTLLNWSWFFTYRMFYCEFFLILYKIWVILSPQSQLSADVIVDSVSRLHYASFGTCNCADVLVIKKDWAMYHDGSHIM